jgi:hypothetical protein
MKVFISYRRVDSQHVAARIYERFIRHFGKDDVFMDVETIDLGEDFRGAISRAVGKCNALLAIIGDNWLNAKDQIGRPRLEDPDDFVRLEIEAALSRGVTAVPLLVGNSAMPSADQLPTALSKLAFCQGVVVRPDPHFNGDVDYLLRHLNAVPELGEDEISIFDFLTKQVDWDAMEEERRTTVKLVLLALLACVDGHEINTDRLAQLAHVVSGGAMNFDLPSS